MGGHGALVCALRNRDQYRSVSAFAPIVAPSHCPWGEKAFTGYLGTDRSAWGHYDASVLVAKQRYDDTILIDQGTADKFLAEQLLPERFVEACRASGTPLELRYREGYDHGYYFISTYVAEHLAFHAERLK
jgi:S-formylglutathione hydrolase